MPSHKIRGRFFKGGRLNRFEVEALLKMALNAYRQEPLLSPVLIFAIFVIPFFTIKKETTKLWKLFSTEKYWCEKGNAGDNLEDSKQRGS